MGRETTSAGEAIGGFDADTNIICAIPTADCANIVPGANLTSCELGNADLSGADLTGAILVNADLTESILDNAILTGANLTGADWRFGRGVNANLTGVIWNDTICPDGTNSNDNGGTCVGHL